MTKRLLFLCAKRTIRAHIAASIFAAKGGDQWDIWSTPVYDSLGYTFAHQVLEEIGIVPLKSPQTTEPLFGLHWDEGVILCSGMASSLPIAPGAGRHRYWSIEDIPPADSAEQEQLLAYRRIRDTLLAHIRFDLLLASHRQAIPLRK